MKKRIHLSNICVGMYIEELEDSSINGFDKRRLLITSQAELRIILASNAMSAIIDTAKGKDVCEAADPSWELIRARFEAELESSFHAGEIRQARECIESTRPMIRQMLSSAHRDGSFDFDGAHGIVEAVMSDALESAGALIAMTKLKDRDEGTFLHCLAVSALMIAFGRSLGLGEETIRDLGLGGLVHDLGKATVPHAVLNKPGKLSPAEFALVRQHPARGAALLRGACDLPQTVLDVCLYHHEKLDGTGYPFGLKEDGIPLAARIAAICDVYDAMVTIRPYKRGWSQAQTVEMMLNSHGHFDRDLLKRFVSQLVVKGSLQ
ncbi:HD-GYP domain-containing protein [Shinella zoogloeoides]|uniref:HD-GYP domain-containing protein n=1 Tax=Shinella zoogloeoides TaxID=352475 RepID=UPI001F57C818|nr:HD-GYP domain-containing protein [Shinella zoogloeoides]